MCLQSIWSCHCKVIFQKKKKTSQSDKKAIFKTSLVTSPRLNVDETKNQLANIENRNRLIAVTRVGRKSPAAVPQN